MSTNKNARKNSIAEGLTVNTDEDQEQPSEENTEEKTENSQENEQPPEGNDGKGSDDSYLEDEEKETSSSDEEELGNEDSVLNKTFDGSVPKLEKSYLEAQKSAGEQARELKKIKRELDDLKDTQEVLDSNPTLKKLYNKAKEGEDVESLVANRRSEPSDDGQSDNSPSNDGKFDGIDEDEFLPDKDKLIEQGYLDDDVDNLNDFDKKASILNAQQAWMSNNLGSQIEQQVRNARKKVKEEELEQKQQDKLKDTNDQRLKEGFDKAITDYSLDFTDKHQGLYEDIVEEVKGFRDPTDGRLIRENAVQLATKEVLKRKGMVEDLPNEHSRPSKPNDAEKEEENFQTKRSGSSSNESSTKSKSEMSIKERMQQRRLEKSDAQIGRRQNLYRGDSR